MSYYESRDDGDYLEKRNRADNEAQKKIVCDFLNSIDYSKVVRLKEIKQRYNSYEKISENIINPKPLGHAYTIDDIGKKNTGPLVDSIVDINNKLKSILTIRQTTKDSLNQQLTSLMAQLNDIINSKSFVDNIYDEYSRIPNARLSVGNFFSLLDDCEVLVPTTAEFINQNNSVETAEARVFKLKYLKYKQKYLNLKNKVN
jgi:hypothetical protein